MCIRDRCYCLDNLGRIHHQHGKCAEAEALFNRSLALRELTLGPEHPNLAYSLNGLGWLLTDQGRLTEAEAAHRRALDLIERQLGRDHVDVYKRQPHSRPCDSARTHRSLATRALAASRLSAEGEPCLAIAQGEALWCRR